MFQRKTFDDVATFILSQFNNKSRLIRRAPGKMKVILIALILIFSFSSMTAHAFCWMSPKSYVKQIGTTGKYLMHLEGTPYQIGYAMGYYRPNDVVKLVHGDYVINVLHLIMPALDIGYSEIGGAGLDLLLRTPALRAFLDLVAADVPYEYKQEMRGIADGVNAALGRYIIREVTYYHVLLVNILPALQYMITSNVFDSLLNMNFEACQGFVAFKNATGDGSTFMGRHFMWTDDPLHETTLLAEYVPKKGKKFVAVTSPGMVGVITGMNTAGLGVGQDMFRPVDKGGFPSGLGMWLLGRKVVQYAGSIAQAESIIRAADEVAPAFILVGDAKGAGAVFEIYNRKVAPRYADWISGDPNAPDAIESKDDLVVVTNHAFTPEMYPIDNYRTNSISRYNVLTNLLLDDYGTMTQETGRQIIDFMHPPSPYYGGFEGDYGDDPTQTVKQHVVFMDLTRGKLWALFGHYDDPWVTYSFR
jgi:hypothetical protein